MTNKTFKAKRVPTFHKNWVIYRNEELIGSVTPKRDNGVYIEAAHFTSSELREFADLVDGLLGEEQE